MRVEDAVVEEPAVFDDSHTLASTGPALPAFTRLGRVYVTGGASGLGAACADAIERHGGAPIVVDRRPARRHPDVLTDLADPRSAEAAMLAAFERHGPPDAIVTCAGVDVPGPFATTPAADWERVVMVNLLGTVAVVRAALPHLEERRGRIVTVASTLGHRAVSDATAYCASKFGVVGFTRALGAELAGRVGVTLLTPGGMRTSFFDGRSPQYRPADDAPLSRPTSIAATVVFALTTPADCEVKEIVVASPWEESWPP